MPSRTVLRTCAPLAGLALLLAVAPAPADAALPPQYQRQRELAAIVESPDVLAKLGGRPIQAVTLIAPDHYRVRSDRCELDIRIGDDPPTASEPARPGPRRFRLVVGEPDCRAGAPSRQ